MLQLLRSGHARVLSFTALAIALTSALSVLLLAGQTRAEQGETPAPAIGAATVLDRFRADLNGDGAPEFLAPYDGFRRDDGVSAVTAFRADGAPALQFGSGQIDDRFGFDTTFVPDLSGDGVPDVLVGAPLAFSGADQTGRAYLFSGVDGAMLRSWAGEAGSRFGKSVASLGDVDGDAVNDLAVGGFVLTDSGDPYGSVHVISGATGNVVRTIAGEQIDDGFGHAITGVHDVNADGVRDFAVSASLAANGSGTRGRVYIFAGMQPGAAPAIVGAEDAIAVVNNPSPSAATFGRWLIADADFDGDGADDLAIVSRRRGAEIGNEGELLVWSGLGDAPFTLDGAIATEDMGVPLAAGEFLLAGSADAFGKVTMRRLTGMRPAPITGDMNGDGVVDANDLEGLIGALSDGDPSGDMDRDGDLDAADLSRGLHVMLGNGAIDGGEDPIARTQIPPIDDPCDPLCFECIEVDEEECEEDGSGSGGEWNPSGAGGHTGNRPPPPGDDGEPADASGTSLGDEAHGNYAETHRMRPTQDDMAHVGAASTTCDPVMLASGVKRELETDLLVSLPGRDFELVRRYDSAMVNVREDRPWMIGGGWATSGDSWLEWRPERFNAAAFDENQEFLKATSDEGEFDPSLQHIRITRFPDQTGSMYLAPVEEPANINPATNEYEPKYFTPFLPTAASVRKDQHSIHGTTFGVWVYERAGEGQVLYYNTADSMDTELQALNGKVVQERDEFGNTWTYTYVVTTLPDGSLDEPRVERIYLNGTTQYGSLGYVEFLYDEGASAASPGSGRLVEARVHRRTGGSWHITQYVKYTYAADLPNALHLSAELDRLVLVESGVQVNAPATTSWSQTPIYHVRATHYRYTGDYLSHTFSPEQVEYFAEHYASSGGSGSGADQSTLIMSAANELASLTGASQVVPGSQSLTVDDLASKIVVYYEDADVSPGYLPGQLTGRVRTEFLQNGCGCSGPGGQPVKIEFEYARRPITDHQLNYSTYLSTNLDGNLEFADAVKDVTRWTRLTTRTESTKNDQDEWDVYRRMRTWSEERLLGLGWVTYYDPDPDGSSGVTLAQITYFNWIPVPLTVANEVTEFVDGAPDRSWRSFFEFEQDEQRELVGYHPTNSYGPSAIASFALDPATETLAYEPVEDAVADPVSAVTFNVGELVNWQEVDNLGRVRNRGVAQVAHASDGGLSNQIQTHAFEYVYPDTNFNTETGLSPRTDLIASETLLPGAAAPAVQTRYAYGLDARPGMRRASVDWMQTIQDREGALQYGPDDGLEVVQTVSYTEEGQPEYAQAPDGSLTHTQYEPSTGAVLQVTRNALWPGAAPLPFGPDRHFHGGSLTSTTTIDALGRPLEQTDELGRTTTITYGLAKARKHTGDPGSATATIEETRLPYLHVVTTPHSFLDAGGQTQYVGPEMHEWGSAAYNMLQTSAFVAGAATPEERARTLHTYALSGKLQETRIWHDLADEAGGSHATTFHYDKLGRESGVTDPNGETLSQVFDPRDRVIERWRSVDVNGQAATELLERTYYDYSLNSAQPPDQGVGEGNATLVEQFLSDSGQMQVRRLVTVFDWRDRPRLSYTAADTGATIANASALAEADNGVYTATIFDEVDRPIEQATLSGGNMMATLGATLMADGYPSFNAYAGFLDGGSSTPSDPLVETVVKTSYGPRGLPFESRTLSYPTDFGAGVAHTTRTWYDDAGRTLVSAGERGPVTKAAYDGLGRVTRTVVTDGDSVRGVAPTFAAATAIELLPSASERVYEVTEPTYVNGVQVRTTSTVRAHDATSLGIGGSPISMYADVVYDLGQRPIAQVNHGTGNAGFAAGTAPPLVDAGTIPDVSDPNTIVTRMEYDELGRAHEAVDPLGRVTRTFFDDLDRVIGTVENARNDATGDALGLAIDDDGYWSVTNWPTSDVEPDENRVTTMAYDGAGNMIRRAAHLPDGSRQITAYIYDRATESNQLPLNVDDFDTRPYSNNMLYEVRYPQVDPSSPNDGMPASDDFSDRNTVLFAYNRAGEQVVQLDQDAVRRRHTRDPSGRIVSEIAWPTLSQDSAEFPIDTSMGAILTDYDRFGRVSSARMHRVTGQDTIVAVERNAMSYVRDALGRVTTITHQPTNDRTLTWDVGYEYEPFTSAFPVSRLAAMTYPTDAAAGTPSRVTMTYGAPGSSDQLLSRITEFKWLNDPIIGMQAIEHEYVGLNRRVTTEYRSNGALAMSRNRHIDPATGGATSGVYGGLDRFGRVRRNVWSIGAPDPANTPPLVDVAYAYDDAGNILSRTDARPGVTPLAANELYEYDGLDRLERATRGALQSPAARSEAWTLDHLGNWTEHYLNANDDGAVDLLDRSTRSHNATNEIESVTDAAGQTQAYLFDDRGAVQAEPLPNEGTLERRRVHQRDLWGRLVTITEQMRPDAQSSWSHAGDVAAYTYYAGNQLATRRADQDGDGVLETTTLYFYDSDWNLLEEQEFIDASPMEGVPPDLTVDADLIRQHLWDPTSSNELAQTRSMVLSGGSYSTPLPVWAATDRRRDVVALRYDLLGGALTGTFRMRYAPYGEPEPVLAGDLNHDGLLNGDDTAVLANLLAPPTTQVLLGDIDYAPDADLNFDGVIDGVDLTALGTLVSNGGESVPGELWGQGANTQLRGMTIGYAGMPYDEQARAYLMRNRWHSPTLGRFLSRDPAGYVDGLSLYAYVTGNPLKYWDPFGLERACSESNWHHMLPQEFEDKFKKAGIENIGDQEFGWLLKRGDHTDLHKAGWNADWKAFLDRAEDQGRVLDRSDIRKRLNRMAKKSDYKEILAKGAQATESYGRWGGRADKDAEFRRARRQTLEEVTSAAGRSGRVRKVVGQQLVKKLPVVAGVFFVADVAAGERVDVAAANTIMVVDVDTVRQLGEVGQQYASDMIDRRRDGFVRNRMTLKYGNNIEDRIELLNRHPDEKR